MLEGTIEQYKRIKKWSWFGDKVGLSLPKEIRVQFPNAEENPTVALAKFLKAIRRFLSELGFQKVIVFPEPGWDMPKEWGIRNATIILVNELEKLANTMEFGLTNYYIVPNINKFEWIITFCHEDDFHIAGETAFINNLQKFLRHINPDV